MSNPSTTLLDLLSLQSLPETDAFEGMPAPPGAPRVFGGHLLGQAMFAAVQTLPSTTLPHSLHASFLAAPDPNQPMIYRVERTRDGRSFTHRFVDAQQDGRSMLRMMVGAQTPENGLDHQRPMPKVADPEGLTPFNSWTQPFAEDLGEWFLRARPVDIRYLAVPPWAAVDNADPVDHSAVWMRTEPLATDDMQLHAAALAYVSDMTILDSAVLQHNLGWRTDRVRAASLDHCMWFHHLTRVDEWFLYDQHSPWTGGGRAMTQGTMFTRSGNTMATVAQEAMMRKPRSHG